MKPPSGSAASAAAPGNAASDPAAVDATAIDTPTIDATTIDPTPSIASILRDRRIDPREMGMLLGHVTGASRTQLLAHPERRLAAAQATQLAALIGRRVAGEPIAYLLGQREFFGRVFLVSPAVLIPRPETELLVELARQRAAPGARVIDLGTGSGAIAVSLACERPDLQVTATDVSAAALALARTNAERLGATLHCVLADWWRGLDANTQYDLVVANPPYIAAHDAHLRAGDLRFEPPGALTDAADGLSALRRIVAEAPDHLTTGGWLLLEHGYDQAAAVRQMLHAQDFKNVQSWTDLAGIERVSGGQRQARSKSC